MGVQRRLGRDARRLTGDPKAAALFECLAEHLFDPALDVHFLGCKCGAPRAVRERLAAKIGPLKENVTELRMMEAAAPDDLRARPRPRSDRLGRRLRRRSRDLGRAA